MIQLDKSNFFINKYSLPDLENYIKQIIDLFMTDNKCDIDSAMNMIKEDIIRELSESISNQKKSTYCNQPPNLSFSEKTLD